MRLRPGLLASGWLLASFVLFLTLYNVRKKLAYFPLFKSASWLQLHIYVGLLSIVLFTLHAGFEFGGEWHVPRGGFNRVFGLIYAVTAISGIVGLLLTRVFPSRITDRGEEFIFERIPIFVRQIRERAADLIVQGVADSDALTLPDFYSLKLEWFFARPRHFWLHLIHSRRPLLTLIRELDLLDRYLNDGEKKIAGELTRLIEKKDAIDYAWALQRTLKGWLFIHIGLTYSLIAFLAVHVLIAFAFTGEVR